MSKTRVSLLSRVMKFRIRTSHGVFLPSAGLQAGRCLDLHGFLVLRSNETCLTASLQCPWALCPPPLCWPWWFLHEQGRGGLGGCDTNPGSRPRERLQQEGLCSVGQPAKPLTSLGPGSLSRHLSVWVQGRQECLQAAETVVVCSEGVYYGKGSQAAQLSAVCSHTYAEKDTVESRARFNVTHSFPKKGTTGFCCRSASSCSGGEIFNLL